MLIHIIMIIYVRFIMKISVIIVLTTLGYRVQAVLNVKMSTTDLIKNYNLF